MNPIKVLLVFGTRPEAIKMAPLVKELKHRESQFETLVCVTAQHRQMLDEVLDCFSIRPDYDLDIMTEKQTLADITGRVLEGLGTVLRAEKPDITLVHGDTTTGFASALSSFYERIPVGHVEAGLRTYNRYSPYPEEINRTLIGDIASYHISPTSLNADNLRREGITENIFVTGNTVIDAMKYTVGDGSLSAGALSGIDFSGRRVIAMTCHRRENYGRPMESIFRAVRRIAEDFPDVTVVYPVHLSPYVQETARKYLGGVQNILLTEPVNAIDMHRLMSKSYFVMTDSGGLQEEAPALGKPVLVLRRETERPEAVTAGTVRLAGTDEDTIYGMARALLTDESEYAGMANAVNPYGDGKACARIADAILYGFGAADKMPEEFRS